MEELLRVLAHYIALAVEGIAILIVAFGSVEALIGIARVMARPGATSMEMRAVWLSFAQWLVAALTFQLAADIVSTSFSATWDEVGRLGVVAVIRTFLSYFLDHEVESNRKLQEAAIARTHSERT